VFIEYALLLNHSRCDVSTAGSQYPVVVDEQGIYAAQPAYTSQVVNVSSHGIQLLFDMQVTFVVLHNVSYK